MPDSRDGDTRPTVPTDLGPPSTGERMGKYLRTERLGGGGMGEVWKAWDMVLDRWVAILHRDLKPESLMASPQGPDWHVIVTDFGLARPLGGAKGR